MTGALLNTLITVPAFICDQLIEEAVAARKGTGVPTVIVNKVNTQGYTVCSEVNDAS